MTHVILLIDGDFRRASIHKQLNLDRSPGLGDILEGRATLHESLVQIEQLPRMHVLCAGSMSGNPAEALDSVQWHRLREQLKLLFRYIVIDSPPAGTVADYDLIQAGCDGIVFVARPDHSDRAQCLRALERLPREKMLGTVLNWIQPWFLNRHRSGYGYYRSACGPHG